MKLAVAFGWHAVPCEALLALVRRAEALGYARPTSTATSRSSRAGGEGDVLDGWTLTTALLARTSASRSARSDCLTTGTRRELAQAAATAERLFPGRLRFLVSIGGQPADRRFGLPFPPADERIAWLDELLDALRALWRGRDRDARRPLRAARGRARAADAARAGGSRSRSARAGRSSLQLVARHADRWDVNLPPVRRRVADAAAALERACRACGRDPAAIERSLWIFARPGRDPGDPALRAEFRRWNPWFADVPDDELGEAIVAGDPADCRRTLAQLATELRLALPVLDCSGLDADAARQVLDAFSPLETLVDRSPPRT